MFAFFLFATLAKKIEKVRAEFGSKEKKNISIW